VNHQFGEAYVTFWNLYNGTGKKGVLATGTAATDRLTSSVAASNFQSHTTTIVTADRRTKKISQIILHRAQSK
jgi:hypothetical protein